VHQGGLIDFDDDDYEEDASGTLPQTYLVGGGRHAGYGPGVTMLAF